METGVSGCRRNPRRGGLHCVEPQHSRGGMQSKRQAPTFLEFPGDLGSQGSTERELVLGVQRREDNSSRIVSRSSG